METAANISVPIARSYERGSLIQGIVNEIFLQVNKSPFPTTPRRWFLLHRRFDVLVVAEQIRWIVLLL